MTCLDKCQNLSPRCLVGCWEGCHRCHPDPLLPEPCTSQEPRPSKMPVILKVKPNQVTHET